MSIIEALNWRYAVKKFSNEQLTNQQLAGLVESVRLAPSAYGIQPYQLIVVSSDAMKQACLPHSYGQDKVANCSHLLLLAHKTKLTQSDTESFITSLAQSQNAQASDLAAYQTQLEADLLSRDSTGQSQFAQQQCYIALGTLLTFAAANGIDACPMTGFDVNGINQALGLNDIGLSAAILCPVGVRAHDDHAASRAKHRLTTDELVVSL
ncbi:nitroreductase family protein [Litorilituus sediminis]|uniref:NAD(P)H-dependent oxidoreductase n=1 Tax=Litorilituus sediminis TaxID=718192 RepID=A0A4P6P7D2_9GAMM|nr:nitroreductase family protein [Litorilituus sediminis]QBG36119.1 NAD(P)H-dependent oxidoreductase [Litorilituus sediminis]